jgi:hypothetical protein
MEEDYIYKIITIFYTQMYIFKAILLIKMEVGLILVVIAII